MSTLDFNNLPDGHHYSVTVAREEGVGDRRVRLFKDLALFLVSLTFVGLLVWLCVDALRSASAGADEKRWAQSVLAAAAGGIVGYLVRK